MSNLISSICQIPFPPSRSSPLFSFTPAIYQTLSYLLLRLVDGSRSENNSSRDQLYHPGRFGARVNVYLHLMTSFVRPSTFLIEIVSSFILFLACHKFDSIFCNPRSHIWHYLSLSLWFCDTLFVSFLCVLMAWTFESIYIERLSRRISLSLSYQRNLVDYVLQFLTLIIFT